MKMNSQAIRPKSTHRVEISLAFLLALVSVLGGCSRQPPGTSELKPQSEATKPEIKLPPKFGVFYESADGPVELGEKTTVAATNPTFILYLEKAAAAGKLRLRFVKAASGSFIADSGIVTSGNSSQAKSAPKPGNYQNVFLLEYGEDAGVFEPQVTAVTGRSGLYKAAYSGTLKPGQYFAFYFVDESKGEMRWKEARFKFAGQFAIK